MCFQINWSKSISTLLRSRKEEMEQSIKLQHHHTFKGFRRHWRRSVDVVSLADIQGWLWKEISFVRIFLFIKVLLPFIYNSNIVNANSLWYRWNFGISWQHLICRGVVSVSYFFDTSLHWPWMHDLKQSEYVCEEFGVCAICKILWGC